MPDDDSPTPRDSGTLVTFEATCVEAFQKLDELTPSDDVMELKMEAMALLSLFRSWRGKAPTQDERVSAVNRLMRMHRCACQLVSK